MSVRFYIYCLFKTASDFAKDAQAQWPPSSSADEPKPPQKESARRPSGCGSHREAVSLTAAVAPRRRRCANGGLISTTGLMTAVQRLLLQVGVLSLSLNITLRLSTITIWSALRARYIGKKMKGFQSPRGLRPTDQSSGI